MRIAFLMGFLLAAAATESTLTTAEAAACHDDTIQGLIRPEENTVPAYEIITRANAYYKVLGPDARRVSAWREADPISLCAGAGQDGLFKITNKRLNKMLDAELTPPPISPFMGAGLTH